MAPTVKNLLAMQKNCVDPWDRKIPGERNGYSLQYSWPGESHGQRSLPGYCPWGCKELDTTEQLSHSHSLPRVKQEIVGPWELGIIPAQL